MLFYFLNMLNIYDKIQYSAVDIKSSKLYMHQSKAERQQADSTNSHYANRHYAEKVSGWKVSR